VGYPGHDPEIYTINASGRDKIQLTHNNKNEFDLSYSPNGKRIAFAGSSEKAIISTRSAPAGEVRPKSRRATILLTHPTARSSPTPQATISRATSTRST
jgi:Tol biopolymer transport system component